MTNTTDSILQLAKAIESLADAINDMQIVITDMAPKETIENLTYVIGNLQNLINQKKED